MKIDMINYGLKIERGDKMDKKPKLCMGCMSPLADDTICPKCGYDPSTPHLPSYLAPKTLLNDRYIVGKILNYNGEGCMYIGYDLVTNTKVQIKEFFPDTLCTRVPGSDLVSINPNKLVQFKNLLSEFTELNKTLLKMRTLSHVCAALDHFAQNNTTYFVFEFIDGKTLKRHLQDKGGELTWQEIKLLFPPVFTTLSLLHNSNIIHRGLSLDTIYFTENGELKLAGFCTLSARSSSSDIIPEMYPGFSAPEQYSASEWQGSWTDVYSLCAVLYRALTGCMPTEAISRLSNDSLMSPHDVNEEIPKDVSDVIMDGMKLKNTSRIQTVTELVTRLFSSSDRSESTRTTTSTIIIPKQGLKPEANHSGKPDDKKISNSKIFVIVMCSTFAVLIIIAIVILSIVLGSKKNPQPSAPEYKDSGISEESENDSEPDSSSEEPDSSLAPAKTIEVPTLIGSIYEGLNAYYTENLKFVPSYEYNETYNNGEIYEQSIEAGKTVDVGTEIKVKVSLGSKYIEVPEFAGLTLEQYKAKVKGLGIAYDEKSKKDEGYGPGMVCDVSIPPHQKYDKTGTDKLIIYYVAEESMPD